MVLAVSIWVARYLGPMDFGALNFAIAFIAFFSWMTHLGLQPIIVRELVKNSDRANLILGTALVMKLTGAVLSILFIMGTIILVEPGAQTIRPMVFILSLMFMFQAFDVISFFFEAKIQSKYAALARGAAIVVSSALRVFLVVGNYGVTWFALASVLDMFIAGFLYAFFYSRIGNSFTQLRFEFKMVQNLLSYSWPIMIGVFLVTIHLKIDQVMIEHYLDLEQLGFYSVAVSLSEAWYFVPAVIGSTVMPYLVKLRTENRILFQYRLVQGYFFMFWMGIAVALVVQLLGQEAIVMLFGPEYRSAFSALALNIWAGVFVAQSVIKGIWNVSENLQVYRIAVNSVAIVVNIVANMMLIPAFGIEGAAMATLLSRVCGHWVAPFAFKPLRQNTLAAIRSINPFYVRKQRELFA